MNRIDMTILKPTLWEDGPISRWKYYYFQNRSYSERCFAYLPTKIISGWIWFKTYYQWYNFSYSIKGNDTFKSIKTLKDIQRFDLIRDLEVDYIKYVNRIVYKYELYS